MNSDEPRPESEAKLKPLVEAASAAIKAFDLEEAERQYRDAVDLAEHFDPPDPLALANVLEGMAGLGELSARLGDVPKTGSTTGNLTRVESEDLRRRARQLVEESAGSESPVMADHLASEATTLVVAGQYEQAGEQLRRALELVEGNPNQNGRRITAILTQLALVQMQTGRATEAEGTLRKAIETARSVSPQPGDTTAPPSVRQTGPAALAGAHIMLGLLYNEDGRYREAEVAARTAVGLCEQLVDPPSQLGTSYNVLAMALRHQWKVREGWSYYRRFMAQEKSRWIGWGWGTRLTMVFVNLLLFIIAPRIKPSPRPRL